MSDDAPQEGGRPEEDTAKPRPNAPTTEGTTPVLALVRPLAAFAAVAVVLGRVVGPSLGGITVGLNRIAHEAEIAASAVSQLLAVTLVWAIFTSLFVVLRSRLPVWFRMLATGLGGFVMLALLTAAIAPTMPVQTLEIVGASAAFVVLFGSMLAWRSTLTRSTARILAFAGIGALARTAAVALAFAADPANPSVLAAAARIAATTSFAAETIALATALTLLGARSTGRGPQAAASRRLWSPASIAVGIGAFVVTRAALGAHDEDPSAFSLIAIRALERLAARPDPLVPLPLRLFVTALAPLLAIALLATRTAIPALGAAIALALLARGAAEVPICAAFLLLAGYAVALAARDERALWGALASTDAKQPPPVGRNT